jgi:hypothetical protein
MQDGRRQKWLVVFNCQAMGLASSLQLLCDGLDVEYHDPSSFTKHQERLLDVLDTFDRVVIAPWVETVLGMSLGHQPNVWRLPAFQFSAYHPDLCNLSIVGGPLRGNHSALAYAAFKAGLDVSQTLQLYRESTYDAMGFFDQWDRTRDEFLHRYAKAGIDLSGAFVDWARAGPFAYTPGHPKIACLRDIAKAALRRDGLRVRDTDLLPHDVMANAVVYPVYPEIASRLGARGDYRFKLPGQYRLIGLEAFVRESHAFYEATPELAPTAPYLPVIERALAVIGSLQ